MVVTVLISVVETVSVEVAVEYSVDVEVSGGRVETTVLVIVDGASVEVSVTVMDVLTSFAEKKGWITAKAGRPDVNRAGNFSMLSSISLLLAVILKNPTQSLECWQKGELNGPSILRILILIPWVKRTKDMVFG